MLQDWKDGLMVPLSKLLVYLRLRRLSPPAVWCPCRGLSMLAREDIWKTGLGRRSLWEGGEGAEERDIQRNVQDHSFPLFFFSGDQDADSTMFFSGFQR